jgi:hypothetical protein
MSEMCSCKICIEIGRDEPRSTPAGHVIIGKRKSDTPIFFQSPGFTDFPQEFAGFIPL